MQSLDKLEEYYRGRSGILDHPTVDSIVSDIQGRSNANRREEKDAAMAENSLPAESLEGESIQISRTSSQPPGTSAGNSESDKSALETSKAAKSVNITSVVSEIASEIVADIVCKVTQFENDCDDNQEREPGAKRRKFENQ